MCTRIYQLNETISRELKKGGKLYSKNFFFIIRANRVENSRGTLLRHSPRSATCSTIRKNLISPNPGKKLLPGQSNLDEKKARRRKAGGGTGLRNFVDESIISLSLSGINYAPRLN